MRLKPGARERKGKGLQGASEPKDGGGRSGKAPKGKTPKRAKALKLQKSDA